MQKCSYLLHWIWMKISSKNPLYLMLNKMNGYFDEINGNKYLVLVPTNKAKIE